MKKNLIGLVMVGIWVGLLQISGCGGDPDPDPCAETEEVKAKFSIGERITNYNGVDTVVVSDTVMIGRIVFSATEEYDSYEWKIGDDNRTFTTPKVELRFLNTESKIPVRLIVKRLQSPCFPNDDGIDTLTQYVTVVNESKTLGIYWGSLTSNPQEMYDVTFTSEINQEFGLPFYRLRNIDKGCNPSDFQFNNKVGYRFLSFDGEGAYYNGCSDPRGFLSISNDDKIIINYSTGDKTLNSRKKFSFKGVRK